MDKGIERVNVERECFVLNKKEKDGQIIF